MVIILEIIDALREEICEDSDKILYDEIKSCIDAKAYRSAYIMTWISIAESLKYLKLK